MRGLHHIRLPQPTWTYRWYSAIQSRRGRRHLIKVPLVAIDLEELITDRDRRLRLPYSMRYASRERREEWAREWTAQNHNLIAPWRIDVAWADDNRLCSMDQPALRYEWEPHGLMYDGTGTRPRGWCDRCWGVWSTLRPTIQDSNRAAPWGQLRAEDLERWTTRAANEAPVNG